MLVSTFGMVKMVVSIRDSDLVAVTQSVPTPALNARVGGSSH